MQNKLQNLVSEILAQAKIEINGQNPWDIQIIDDRFFSRVIRNSSLGFGESYMDGWWECSQLDTCLEKIAQFEVTHYLKKNWFLLMKIWGYYLKSRFFNQQSKNKTYDVGLVHYDLGNDLFQVMLDPTMNYSCAYWKNSNNLADAQIAKLKLICDKLELRPGLKLLDIGCGWGGLAAFAAENYGVEVTGITISRQQYELAKKRCENLPVTIQFQDYRSLSNEFDRIVSVGMFEHVGFKNYAGYMRIVHNLLKKNGLFLLHTIGNSISTYATDPWIDKYIFPHGMLPSIKQIGESIEHLFVMEDWHNFGADYDKTLMAWHDNFIKHWPSLSSHYGERFFRMWKFYLLSCAGFFRARKIQLWQIVLSKSGISGGYQSIR